MSDKETAIELIQHLPDSASLQDIVYELYVHERIARGLDEADKGLLVPHEEVKKEIAAWLRSNGQ